MKKVGQVIAVIFLLLFIIGQFFNEVETTTTTSEELSNCSDQLVTDSAEMTRSILRSWRDQYLDDSFCLAYKAQERDNDLAADYRNQLVSPNVRSDYVYWGKIYRAFFEHDRTRLSFLEDSIRNHVQQAALNDREVVHYVVSLVQDIPYQYIMPESCEGYSDHPCQPNQRFGLLSPVEFLFTLTGDCDTRTVLLYTMLTNLGYQPVIVNSVQYGHSMLAINLPSDGDYLIHQGQRFYFWETTATGWQPGMLPPDMNNPNYWTVVLDQNSI